MAIIYKATNKTNGKAFIGLSRTWPLGKNAWLDEPHFNEAVGEYGKDGFEWFVLLSDGTLSDKKQLVEEHNTSYGEGGYNVVGGIRKVVRKGIRSKDRSDWQLRILREQARKLRLFGHSMETRAKISVRMRGRPKSEAHKKAISECHAARKASGAYYQSPEYKAKMSKALKGKVRTPEQRERYRQAALNRKRNNG